MSNSGPSINLIVKKDAMVNPVGSCGVLVATYNIYKPTFYETFEES